MNIAVAADFADLLPGGRCFTSLMPFSILMALGRAGTEKGGNTDGMRCRNGLS